MNLKQHLLAVLAISASVAVSSCGSGGSSADGSKLDTLPEDQRHLTANALRGLKVADGLEVTLMAAEPAIKNPTNIDVDDRGRIWVTEAFNYRPEPEFRNHSGR